MGTFTMLAALPRLLRRRTAYDTVNTDPLK